MLARCLVRPFRVTSLLLNRSSASILFVRDNLRNQLIQNHKFTTSLHHLNEHKHTDDKANSKLKNYERLRDRLTDMRTKTEQEIQNLAEFEHELDKLGLIQKFKKIVSEYWHVIIVMHALCSAVWFALACLIKFQFDLTPEPLIKYLEQHNVPGFFIEPLRNKYLQFIAVPFFLYKCVTPIRYYSTVYFSMIAIRHLIPKGIIRAKKTPRIIEILFGAYVKKK